MNTEINTNLYIEQDDLELELELFAEELPDQTELATPNFCTAGSFGTTSSFSTAGGCSGTAACGSSFSSVG